MLRGIRGRDVVRTHGPFLADGRYKLTVPYFARHGRGDGPMLGKWPRRNLKRWAWLDWLGTWKHLEEGEAAPPG